MSIFDLKEADYYDSKVHTDKEIYDAVRFKENTCMNRVIMHNLRDWSFETLGAYKLQKEEADYILDVFEHVFGKNYREKSL